MMKFDKAVYLKLVWCMLILGLFAHPAFTQTVSKTRTYAAAKKAGQINPKPAVTAIKWIMEAGPSANLKLLTHNKQLFCLDNQLILAAIENGKINIYQNEEGSQWTHLQTLENPEIAFTTFIVKDINNDQIPEIIGGTTEPGYIYIYYRDQTGQWSIINEAKYIWSTVTRLTTANFAGNSTPVLIVQNKEGILFVFKPSETALDLIWKSPTACRPFEDLAPVDVDHDGSDELIGIYRNGGVTVLRSVKNALNSVWEYFSWGKILSINYLDWDNNNTMELVLPTTQKLVCVIRAKNKNFYAGQESNDYVIDKIFLGKFQNRKTMITTDTSGKTHIAEYSAKATRCWKETQVFQTGRILDIFVQDPNEIILVNQGLQLIRLKIEMPNPTPSLMPTTLPEPTNFEQPKPTNSEQSEPANLDN